jgi:hypothetical protein
LAGVVPGFVRPEAYIIFRAHFKKKYKSTNTKLGTNVNVYLEWTSQQITYLKYVTPQTSQNPEKWHNILLINCL